MDQPTPPPARSGSPTSVAQIFDRRLLAMRRRRAARRFGQFNFLKVRTAQDILERLDDINRSFESILDLGAHNGEASRLLREHWKSAQTRTFVTSDIAEPNSNTSVQLCVDEECLPFKTHAFDLIVSALSLHWVNDLPGALIQIQRTLQPDGLFVGAMFGGRTLHELRSCLTSAEESVRGGAATRVSPFLDILDGAGLLQRAGFAMPVSDTETIPVRYDNMFGLLRDLRGMGETACFRDRRAPPLTRTILTRAAELYAEQFSDPDGRIRATFEIVWLSGWAPAPNQPKPKRPGSATIRLADALGVSENKLSDD